MEDEIEKVYREMAADVEAEAEALEWIEGTAGDVGDEPWDEQPRSRGLPEGTQPRPFTAGYELGLRLPARFSGLTKTWLKPDARRTLKRPLDLMINADHAVNDVAKCRENAGSLVNEAEPKTKWIDGRAGRATQTRLF